MEKAYITPVKSGIRPVEAVLRIANGVIRQVRAVNRDGAAICKMRSAVACAAGDIQYSLSPCIGAGKLVSRQVILFHLDRTGAGNISFTCEFESHLDLFRQNP